MAPTRPKRVTFEGAEYVEYDAEQPVVVRLCGAALAGPSSGGTRRQSVVALECQARGLDAQAIAAAGGSAERALERQYAQEIKQSLAVRGFSPLSEGLGELRTQLRVADLLLSWAALASPSDSSWAMEVDSSVDATDTVPKLERVLPNGWKASDITDPSLLRQTQLAKKELEGRVDESYAFGRRFVSTETFIDSLERCELLELARERELLLPEVEEAEKATIKIPDRELVALRGPGAGKALKQLTLRELVAEAQAHGIDVDRERGGGAKKSKRAWIDILRPLVHDDILKIRVLMREEELLRELLASVIEREAAEDQRRRVRALICKLVDQFKATQSCQPDTEPAIESPTSTGDVDKTMADSVDGQGRLDRYFEQLAAAIQPPSEQGTPMEAAQ